MTFSDFKEKADKAIRSLMVSSDPPVEECLTNSVFNYNAGLLSAIEAVWTLDCDPDEQTAYYNYILISLNKYSKGRDVDWNNVAKAFEDLKSFLSHLGYDIHIIPFGPAGLTASIVIKNGAIPQDLLGEIADRYSDYNITISGEYRYSIQYDLYTNSRSEWRK